MRAQLEVITKLVEVAPAIIDSKFETENHCIASTRHGLEALRYFGIDAKPQKTQAIAANAAWLEWFDAGQPGGAMPDGAWSVGIDLNDHGNGYAGHLVLVAKLERGDVLVDLNSGQLSRPARGMPVPPAIVLPLRPGWRERGAEVWTNDAKDVAIVHRFLPQRDWHYAPDWRLAPPWAGEIIRAIR